MRTIEATGKTIEDAVRSGLVRLGLMEEEVTIEVLAEPKSGFLGFGSKPAKVRLTEKARKTAPIYDIEEEERKAAPPAEPKAAEAAQAEAVTAEAPEEPVEEPAADEAEPAEETFTAEEAAAKAKAFLQDVLRNMGIDVMIEKMIKSDKIILHLHGKNLGILIGKHGQTLDALQYLTNLTTNQGEETRHFIMLDVENYRQRREETLKQLAVRLAGRVKRSGEKVVLEPMNGYERKIIHVALQNEAHVRTESEGQDPYRHVVIYYEK
ncbi:protein jag [Megasphaera butyrica]|uniref:RNA-binding cell elongation regulator Jag/EloR n=1 Tax=Megasphaera TaxID=906 RepID=UPI000822390E|nr:MULTISPECIES: RNA-binding cell elongation regulator Jag/EloR [Megasphaera]SCJ09180.1 R3H domain [uncultured Ruminococcus sp.]MBM6731366.1 protein jag [Megasphaera stantonii]MCU6714137.1 protein jag [Megasphaera butyrica]NJE35391.1 protein jag [Megasphaera sp. SW808]SCH40461.1 R3H domain [uncultured Megasphaera sp.]